MAHVPSSEAQMAHADDPHHGHHVLTPKTLLTVFGVLIFFTILTVVLGLMERSGAIHLGAMSVPVALAIAGVKATLVAMYFMGLKYDNRTNVLAFCLGIVFLVVFIAFTWFDTGFRDTFEDVTVVPIDQQEAERKAALERIEMLRPQLEAQPLVTTPDAGALLPGATPTTE